STMRVPMPRSQESPFMGACSPFGGRTVSTSTTASAAHPARLSATARARPHRRHGGQKLADRREKLVARALAAATDFGTEPAVLVVRGVPVALLGTGEAGDATRFDHRADKAQVRRGLAGHNSAGRVADVGAVEAEANAAHRLPNV